MRLQELQYGISDAITARPCLCAPMYTVSEANCPGRHVSSHMHRQSPDESPKACLYNISEGGITAPKTTVRTSVS